MLGPGVPFTGRIIVRLSSAVANAVSELLATTPSLGPQGLDHVLATSHLTGGFPNVASLRVHLTQHNAVNVGPTVPPALVSNVRQWEADASHTDLPPQHSLFSYWIVDMRGASITGGLHAVARSLATHPQIDLAYPERNLREPAWAVSDDAKTPMQEYLWGITTPQNGKFGINAHNAAVWGAFNGAGVGLVDIERGWRLTHQDFPPGTPLLVGANVAGGEDHGTKSVGVAVAIDHPPATPLGTVGIAPGATLRGVASRVSATDPSVEWELTEALMTACSITRPGDVILVECETAGGSEGGYPVEVDAHHFDAIRLACAIGNVVIEPAGNGWNDINGSHAHDLDMPLPGYWTLPAPILNRNSVNFDDSGAVMVSSCGSATAPLGGHTRLISGSYGTRIDCYAWGENVHAPSALGSNPDTAYTAMFGGTSAASAIIAGAVLLIQDMAGQPLSPLSVRTLLSRFELGTPIYDIGSAPGSIPVGTMPDLQLIAAELGLVPDVFIRDNLEDDGSVPSLYAAASPDIIVRSAPVANSQAAFGEGSGVEQTLLMNDDIVLDQKNYLYIRMRNRGPVIARGVVATVYWAEAGALIAPIDWNLIGLAAPVDVPAPNAFGAPYGPLTVTQAIAWTPTAATLPVSHACFIAVLHHPKDPAPAPIAMLAAGDNVDWDTFLAFITAQNNVAWRNFNVLQLSPLNADTMAAAAAFNIGGGPSAAAAFDFEIEREGPEDHRWSIGITSELARRLTREPIDAEDADDAARHHRPLVMRIEERSTLFQNVRLPKRTRYRCVVSVRIPRRSRPAVSRLSIVQRARGIVIGRVTFIVNEESWPS